MKKFVVVLAVVLMSLSMATVSMAQSSTAPGAEVPSVGGAEFSPSVFILSASAESAFASVIDALGLNPPGATRLDIGFSFVPGAVRVNTQTQFGLPCSAVSVFGLNGGGVLIRLSHTCNADNNELYIRVFAQTHYFFYSFGGAAAPAAYDVVRQLTVEL